jgi:hypothetical protein
MVIILFTDKGAPVGRTTIPDPRGQKAPECVVYNNRVFDWQASRLAGEEYVEVPDVVVITEIRRAPGLL